MEATNILTLSEFRREICLEALDNLRQFKTVSKEYRFYDKEFQQITSEVNYADFYNHYTLKNGEVPSPDYVLQQMSNAVDAVFASCLVDYTSMFCCGIIAHSQENKTARLISNPEEVSKGESPHCCAIVSVANRNTKETTLSATPYSVDEQGQVAISDTTFIIGT